MSVPTWTKRESLPKPGHTVFIDGRKGEVKYVGPNKSGSDVVQILYAGAKTPETTTLVEFLASLEVKA